MLNRRGFLAALLGTAAVPKEVLAGLATPAPVRKAVSKFVWREIRRDETRFFFEVEIEVKWCTEGR